MDYRGTEPLGRAPKSTRSKTMSSILFKVELIVKTCVYTFVSSGTHRSWTFVTNHNVNEHNSWNHKNSVKAL